MIHKILLILLLMYSTIATSQSQSIMYRMGMRQGLQVAEITWNKLDASCSKLDVYASMLIDSITRLNSAAYSSKPKDFRHGYSYGLSAALARRIRECERRPPLPRRYNQQQDFESILGKELRLRIIHFEPLCCDGTVKVVLTSKVLFDFDSSKIKRTFKPVLNKLARFISVHDRTVVHIVGHTDSTGSDAYNQRLSEKRAVAVAKYLNQKGVKARRILTEGRGESDPRASNRNASGRQLNRRVEIYLRTHSQD